MADPTAFPEANRIRTRPPNMTDEECISLPVFTNGEVCVSRWQPTADDLERLVRGAPIWVLVVSGETQPPISITTENPFATERERAEPEADTRYCGKCLCFRPVAEFLLRGRTCLQCREPGDG